MGHLRNLDSVGARPHPHEDRKVEAVDWRSGGTGCCSESLVERALLISMEKNEKEERERGVRRRLGE